MKMSKIVGIIKSFNEYTTQGIVNFKGQDFEFSSTIFNSGLPFRFPKKGDVVESIFNDDKRLISLRIVKKSDVKLNIPSPDLLVDALND